MSRVTGWLRHPLGLLPTNIVFLTGLLTGASAAESELPWDAARYKGWEVVSFEIRGVSDELLSPLTAGLALAPQSRLLRGAIQARFFPAVLQQDLERIRLYLARNGYPQVEPTVDLVPNPKKQTVAITVRIGGKPVRVAAVRLSGFPPNWTTTADDLDAVRAGRVFSDAAAQTSAGRLQRELRNAGYAKAEVGVVVDHESRLEAAVTFRARPGSVYFFRRTLIQGGPDDLQDLARTVADIPPGDVYAARRIRTAEGNLRLLDLFARIRVTTVDAGPESLDVLVELSQGKPRTVEVGGGFWTDEGIRGTAIWKHRNLFRRGRALQLSAQASRYTQEGAAVLRLPAVLWPRASLLLQSSILNQIEENYEQFDLEAALLLRYSFSPRSQISAGPSVAFVNLSVEEGFEAAVLDENVVVDFRLRGRHDLSDDPLRPTRGGKFEWRLEWAPPPVSDSRYYLGEVETVWYASLPLDSILRSRLNLGTAQTYSGTEALLPNRRFFSGGGNTHRGFARHQLGPLDANGDPVGGEALLNASLDLRFPLFFILNGALFVDAGQVWPDPSGFRFEDIEVAVGPGIWIDTPIGPFRFDYGFRLTDASPEPESQYHIAIGNPF